MNPLKITFVLFFTFIVLSLFGQDKDKQAESIDKLNRELQKCERINREEISKLQTQIEILSAQMWSEAEKAAAFEKKLPDGTEDPAAPKRSENNETNYRTANLQSEINRLNQEIDKLKRRINQQQQEIAALTQENTDLKGELSDFRTRLDRAVADLNVAQAETQRLQDIIDCTDDFFVQRVAARNFARLKIEEANEMVRFLYLQSDTKLKEYEKSKRVNDAFDIFMEYGGGANSTECFGRQLSYEDDYLNAREHLMVVDLLAANRYNVAEKLDEDISGRVNKLNNLLLKNLGAAYEKGSYDERSDATAISEKVGFLIVSEKKGKSGMDASEVLIKIRDIRIAFDKEDYAEAVKIYNKYERFFTIEDVKDEIELVADAQYAVGTILAWNLASIADYRGLYINGTWLDENIDSRLAVGRRLLLNEVLNNRKLENNKLKREAMLALRKQYQRRGSNDVSVTVEQIKN